MVLTNIRHLNAAVEREALFLRDPLGEVYKVMVGQETMVGRPLGMIFIIPILTYPWYNSDKLI
jgi:hypothetical protein